MADIIVKNIDWIISKVKSHTYKRDKNLWVFGEWFGNRCCDNSLYFANYVAEHHPEIKLVWIAKNTADTSALHPAVKKVEMGTEEAAATLRHAGVAVMNQDLKDFSEEIRYDCDGAVTVNLWHGVPWKKIGLDCMGDVGGLKRIYGIYLRKLQRADLHLALSDDFADILERKFFAKREGIILSGYPRNSLFYDKNQVLAARQKAVALLRDQDKKIPDDVKIITYMPTFRDNTQEVFSFEQMEKNERLNEILQKHHAVIVQRAHFVTSQRNNAVGAAGNSRITSLEGISSQELLAATDLLITDYSSCFFDFLMLDRPIIHYLYDYDYYANQDRGLYYKKEDVACGDTAATTGELLELMEQNLSAPDQNAALRQCRRQQFMTYETKDSCRIIFEEIQKRLK